jgi:hypothetical protein
MKKHAVLAICFSCLLLLGLAIFGIRRTRVETLQSLVSKNLKLGASSGQVIIFLDAHHLEPSKLMKPEAMRYGSHVYSNENVVLAIKRNTWVGFLETESIQLVFVFNDNNELVRFDVFPVYTGM